MNKEDLLNGFFENSLTEEDQMRFENLLKEDADFQQDFEFQRELQRAIKKGKRAETKAFLADINGDKIPHKTKVFKLNKYWAAASIVFLLALAYTFFQNKGVDNDKLYATYFEPYANVVKPINRGVSLENMEDRAFSAYESGEYEEALRLFQSMDANQAAPYINFYKGISLMELERYDEAIDRFESYLDSQGNLSSRAYWYLALSHLKKGEKDETIRYLEMLITKADFKRVDAQKLLDKLD